MTLPTSRELQNLLAEATPAPWNSEQFDVQRADRLQSTNFWVSGEDEREIATVDVLPDYHDQTERNFTLISLAPQLAEEVIRLRKKLARIEQDCLDKADEAKDAALRFSRSEADKEYWRGRADSYNTIYQKHLED